MGYLNYKITVEPFSILTFTILCVVLVCIRFYFMLYIVGRFSCFSFFLFFSYLNWVCFVFILQIVLFLLAKVLLTYYENISSIDTLYVGNLVALLLTYQVSFLVNLCKNYLSWSYKMAIDAYNIFINYMSSYQFCFFTIQMSDLWWLIFRRLIIHI